MRELGCAEYEKTVLALGYRCPPDVVSLAHHVLGRGDVSDVRVAPFDAEGPLVAWIAGQLEAIERVDERASVAIICRTPLAARRMSQALGRETTHRLVQDGSFVRGARCYVTSVDQVKGLEFDAVLVPDASAAAYPDTPVARRALYVAVTRARRSVVLARIGEASAIVA